MSLFGQYWSCIFVDIINFKKSCSQMPSVSTELLKELLRVVKFSVLPYLNFWQKSQTVAYKKKLCKHIDSGLEISQNKIYG